MGWHRILFVLLTIRLLMPPGICACKWNAPAARLLVALAGKPTATIPPAPAETDDDHAPGCPASFLAVGMGVWPPSEPVPSPDLSSELLPVPATSDVSERTPGPAFGCALDGSFPPAAEPLYLAQCSLLI